MNKIMCIILCILCVIGSFTSCAAYEDDGKIKVVATNFAMYDFSRAVCGDECSVEMLLAPGSESHDFEATLEDVAKIASADIFVYVGGESDEWVYDVLDSSDISVDSMKIVRAIDCVETYSEDSSLVFDAEHEHTHSHEDSHDELSDVDEHVWTSIPNAILIINEITEAVAEICPESSEKIKENAERYIEELRGVDSEMTDMINGADKNLIIVADRFPFIYMTEHYGLRYYAAFDGCSSATEPSLAVINSLVEKTRENEIDTIFVIEFSDRRTASAIAEETGCTVLELSSAHNITRSELESGITYADVMRRNISALKEALN